MQHLNIIDTRFNKQWKGTICTRKHLQIWDRVTSPVAWANPLRPLPITVGICIRMYSQLPVLSPVQMTAYLDGRTGCRLFQLLFHSATRKQPNLGMSVAVANQGNKITEYRNWADRTVPSGLFKMSMGRDSLWVPGARTLISRSNPNDTRRASKLLLCACPSAHCPRIGSWITAVGHQSSR